LVRSASETTYIEFLDKIGDYESDYRVIHSSVDEEKTKELLIYLKQNLGKTFIFTAPVMHEGKPHKISLKTAELYGRTIQIGYTDEKDSKKSDATGWWRLAISTDGVLIEPQDEEPVAHKLEIENKDDKDDESKVVLSANEIWELTKPKTKEFRVLLRWAKDKEFVNTEGERWKDIAKEFHTIVGEAKIFEQEVKVKAEDDDVKKLQDEFGGRFIFGKTDDGRFTAESQESEGAVPINIRGVRDLKEFRSKLKSWIKTHPEGVESPKKKKEKEQKPVFFSQAGANYIVSPEKLQIKKESFGLLVPGETYLKIGSKKRSAFEWTVPATYEGTYILEGEKDGRHILFNETEDKGQYFYYAFPVLGDGKTALQFTTSMKSSRDIVIDTAIKGDGQVIGTPAEKGQKSDGGDVEDDDVTKKYPPMLQVKWDEENKNTRERLDGLEEEYHQLGREWQIVRTGIDPEAPSPYPKDENHPFRQLPEQEQARRYAKRMIYPYVQRGDSLKSIKDSQHGSYGSDFSGSIGGHAGGKKVGSDKISISRLGDNKGKSVEYVFPTKELYNEIRRDIPPFADGGEIMTEIMTEESYLARKGASSLGFGDSALHKNRGKSERAWQANLSRQGQKDSELMELRQKLRLEYAEKVQKGELRPPTRIEQLVMTAKGHEDLESTQAARRILLKKGIDYKKWQN
jgi:hypothetical protein